MEQDPRIDDAKEDRLAMSGPIGFRNEIHGRGAHAVPAFVPSRHELLELFKYWMRERLECEAFWRFYQQIGSWEIRIMPFANMRMTAVATALDDPAAIEAAEKEAFERFLSDHHLTAEQWEHDDLSVPQ